jgi:hypothetical protein
LCTLWLPACSLNQTYILLIPLILLAKNLTQQSFLTYHVPNFMSLFHCLGFLILPVYKLWQYVPAQNHYQAWIC